MGRISFNSTDNYGGGSGSNFFKLTNDKDTARVRFMIDGEEGLDNIAYAVHKIKLGDKYRSVSCLREYNEPVSKCPFCEEYANVQARFYIPLYNVDDDEVQIWERGKTFGSQIAGQVARYGTGKKGPFASHIFEIERNGKSGDMKTTYSIYEEEKDDITLEDLPEVPDLLGSVILEKSADDMYYFIDSDEFPPEDNEEYNPIRRRSSNTESDDEEELPFNESPEDEEEKPRRSRERRTPSNSSKTRRSF